MKILTFLMLFLVSLSVSANKLSEKRYTVGTMNDTTVVISWIDTNYPPSKCVLVQYYYSFSVSCNQVSPGEVILLNSKKEKESKK